MAFKQFEDLPIYQDSLMLVKEIYELTNKDKFCKDYSLKDQIRRAIISVISNIAEGFERDSKNEFIRFLLYSKGSIGEVRTQILISKELKYINEEYFNSINKKCISISKQIAKFINYLKNYKR